MTTNNIKYEKLGAAMLIVFVLVASLYWLVSRSDRNDRAPVAGTEIEANHDTDANSTGVTASPNSGAAAEIETPGPLPSPGPVSSGETIAPVEELPLPAFDDEYVDALIRVPVHNWQKERSDNIDTETIEQTIRNLANIDDLHLAHTSISGIPPMNTSPAFQSLVVTRMARVRRILSEGRNDPKLVVPHLRKVYEDALTRWPKAIRDKLRALHAGRQPPRDPGNEPDLGTKYETRAIAATYLLAELGDHESLPLLFKGYEIHGYPYSATEIYAPVPPAITLYAMHRLVQSFPEEKLNAEARNVRFNYLEQAKCLPPPRDILVTKSWYARYDESDPRIAVLDREKKVLRDEPTMSMVVYPHRFTDGKRISTSDGKVSERAKLLFTELEKFIKAQY